MISSTKARWYPVREFDGPPDRLQCNQHVPFEESSADIALEVPVLSTSLNTQSDSIPPDSHVCGMILSNGRIDASRMPVFTGIDGTKFRDVIFEVEIRRKPLAFSLFFENVLVETRTIWDPFCYLGSDNSVTAGEERTVVAKTSEDERLSHHARQRPEHIPESPNQEGKSSRIDPLESEKISQCDETMLAGQSVHKDEWPGFETSPETKVWPDRDFWLLKEELKPQREHWLKRDIVKSGDSELELDSHNKLSFRGHHLIWDESQTQVPPIAVPSDTTTELGSKEIAVNDTEASGTPYRHHWKCVCCAHSKNCTTCSLTAFTVLWSSRL